MRKTSVNAASRTSPGASKTKPAVTKKKSPKTPATSTPSTSPTRRRPRPTTATAKVSTSKQVTPPKSSTKTTVHAPVFEYEVCLSFAGEDRAFVEKVVRSLKRRRISFFYDFDEQAILWGKDLYTHLDDVYRNKSRYCVMFSSKSYLVKKWTNHERQSIQARMFESKDDYLLQVRLDDTEIPGVRPTLGYVDGRRLSPEQVAAKVKEKLLSTAVSKPVIRVKTQNSPAKKLNPALPGAVTTTVSRRKVSSSGRWIMLGSHFYETSLVLKEKNEIKVQIAPKTTREEAELKALETGPQWTRSAYTFAHRDDAFPCHLENVSSRSENGKPIYTLTFQSEATGSQHWEMPVGDLSASEVAEKRARLMLLNEEPSTGSDRQDIQIKQGFNRESYEAGILVKSVKAFGGALTQQNLQRARLVALYHLTKTGIIDQLLDLSLTTVGTSAIKVDFEGRRRSDNNGTAVSVIGFTGIVSV